jgi:lon-related putative ATP-dependent protease
MSTKPVANAHSEVSIDALRRRCDPNAFDFATTAELGSLGAPVGQRRAADALTFGAGIRQQGFNIYVCGAPGTGRTSAVREFLQAAATGRATPDDWCYVYSRRDPSRPRSLRLPAGQGRVLQGRLRELVVEARRKIPRAFESDEYAAQREVIMGEFNHRRDQGMQELAVHAERSGFLLQPTPTGITIIPTLGHGPLTDEDIAGLRQDMRDEIKRKRTALEAEVDAYVRGMIAAERALRERIEAQDRNVADHAVAEVMEALDVAYTGQSALQEYLADVREEILADIGLFLSHPLPLHGSLPEPTGDTSPEHAMHERALRKYEVNLLVDNSGATGAPVIFEGNPNYPNLIGRIEREAVYGALLTDHTLISAGALHRASGGYLVFRLADVLLSPLCWEALKRSLREGVVAIEDAGEVLGLGSARGLRPVPIPIDVKVVLIGEPLQFELLNAYDPDFQMHFKVRVDFDSVVERTHDTERAYAAILGRAGSESGRALDREAVALLIEESSRLAADQHKLSARLGVLTDVVREAAYWAAGDGADVIGAVHVRKAVEQRRQRVSLVADRSLEMVRRGSLLVRPEGEAVGQIHGLAVVEAGGAVFGRPSRITATVAAGRDGVLDIERQVELGGPIHSKGVLILAGYLADLYAQDKPLALSARIVFEQSYEGIEGDSASLAELLVLLSWIAEVPLRQDMAITGSVNQHGEVQAVGGVNEKIEGFFDVCVATGLTGGQGVILPASNVGNLMLREDVLDAVQAGRFRVHAVASVDQALELMTGLPAGARGADGKWSDRSVHARVDARLRTLAEALRRFAEPEQRPARNGRHPA